MRSALALAALLFATPATADFTDQELINGFNVTVFGAEVVTNANGPSRIVKKFTRPVRAHVVEGASPAHAATVRRFLTRLSGSVHNLSLVSTGQADAADMVIYLTKRAAYAQTIRATVWPGVDTAFLEANACSAVIAARRSGIERAFVYLPTDEGFVAFSHCMVEEITQALGPANDSETLPDSIFNDQSELNVFGIFDWYLLNMLYDPRIRPGMTEADVRPLLPRVIADVRRRAPAALKGSLAHHGLGRR
ncbi:MAG: DUF2927 domain-containing protein [Pseudomonadota bacterium]